MYYFIRLRRHDGHPPDRRRHRGAQAGDRSDAAGVRVLRRRDRVRHLVERFDRRGTEPFELYRARSRLYRNEILQENTRWRALAEIFTMHSFALL